MKEKQFKWKGYDWQVGPIWGYFHHDKNDVWYGTDSVSINEKDELILDCILNPKTCEDNKTRLFSVGFVTCRKEMKYGVFEWECELPIGKNMWPGLWISSNQEWPPEIDCMEAWSKKCANTYRKRLLWYNIHPTCHWKENGQHKYDGKLSVSNVFFMNEKKSNKYKLVWTPEKVEIYYNYKKIATFNDHKMLEHFNKEDIYMSPIITFDLWDKHGSKFTPDKYKNYRTKGKPFIINNFSYTPIEGVSKERYDPWWKN